MGPHPERGGRAGLFISSHLQAHVLRSGGRVESQGSAFWFQREPGSLSSQGSLSELPWKADNPDADSDCLPCAFPEA